MRRVFRVCVSVLLLSACFLFGAVDKAAASFSVCNHTDAQQLLFAQAHQTHGSYTSSGYTEVARGKCAQTVGADLRERWFYVRWIIAGLGYGSSANSNEFCVLNIPFTVEQADSQAACNKAARSMSAFSISKRTVRASMAPFVPLDTKGRKHMILYIKNGGETAIGRY